MENKIKIVALFGEAGAGKDACLHEICAGREGMFNEIISTTTRPPRQGEKNGINYNFITEEEFCDKENKGAFLETTEYKGTWFYGTEFSALDSNKINVGVFNPQGIYTITNDLNLDIFPVWVWASPKTRLMRQLVREPNPDCDEIVRRFKSDEEDFEDFYRKESGIRPFIVWNDDHTPSENCDHLLNIMIDMYKGLNK